MIGSILTLLTIENEELVNTIKGMYLFLSERATTVGMLPDELLPYRMIMSPIEFEYKFLPRLIKVKIRLTLVLWMVKKGYASY